MSRQFWWLNDNDWELIPALYDNNILFFDLRHKENSETVYYHPLTKSKVMGSLERRSQYYCALADLTEEDLTYLTLLNIIVRKVSTRTTMAKLNVAYECWLKACKDE